MSYSGRAPSWVRRCIRTQELVTVVACYRGSVTGTVYMSLLSFARSANAPTTTASSLHDLSSTQPRRGSHSRYPGDAHSRHAPVVAVQLWYNHIMQPHGAESRGYYPVHRCLRHASVIII